MSPPRSKSVSKRGTRSTALVLPKPLADFFAAENQNDLNALGACFVEHAVLRDEGRSIHGVSGITQWMQEAKNKYQHTVEPIAVATRDHKTVVTARVSGKFPNSPVTLDHVFAIEGNKIASLEIG